MVRVLQKTFGIAIASMVVVSFAGCADTTGLELPYPKLAAVKRIKDKLLTKDEQDAAIQDLSLEQENHRGKAIEAIEKTEAR